MAVNPITTDDLTIDLASLLSLSVGDRVQAAASDPGFAQALMQSLTPIQLAKAFPDYYRKELPDISNFILANRYLDSGGRFDQYGGGDYGEHKDMYGGGASLDNTARPTGIPQPTVEEMKAKLLEKGIDVEGAFAAIENGLSVDDPKVEFLKNMPAEKLVAMGIETYKDENGNSMFRMKPIEEATMSNEEIIKQSTSKVGARPEGMNTKQSVMYGLQKRGFTKEEAAAVAGNVDAESSFRPGIVNSIGAVGYMQWLGARKQGLFNYAQSVGKDWSDPEVQLDYIALERSGESVKYSGPNSSEKASYDKAFASGDPIQMAADFGRFVERPSAAELETSMNTRIRGAQSAYETDVTTYTPVLDENSTPQQIEEARKTLIENRKKARLVAGIRETYNLPSPTSSAQGLNLEASRGSALGFLDNNQRNPDGANLIDVDDRLLEIAEMGIKKFEAENPNMKVEIYGPNSGKRTTSRTKRSQHLFGKALDFEIYQIDPNTGQKIKRMANFANQSGAGEAADEYLRLHQNIELARIYKKDVLQDERYAGVYGRSGALLGGEYALDTQHYDIGGTASADGIQSSAQPGGSIFGGYSEEYMRRFGIQDAARLEQSNLLESAKLAYGPKLIEDTTQVATNQTTSEPQTAEISVPTPASTAPEVQSFQFGGTPTLQDDEDLTAVGPDGKPRFKFNSGEGLYVKPEANEYADDKIDELSGRLDKMAESQNQPQRRMMETQEPKADPRWAEKVADAYRPAGTQQRAFNRAQFRSEGRHVGDRGSPNIA